MDNLIFVACSMSMQCIYIDTEEVLRNVAGHLRYTRHTNLNTRQAGFCCMHTKYLHLHWNNS